MKTDTDRSPILMRRSAHGLSPVTGYDAERLDTYSLGQDLEVIIKQRRSMPQQRLYWVTLHNVIAATGAEYPSAEALHEAIKLALGYVKLLKRVDTGAIVAVPDSTAFGNMDQAAFGEFFEKAVALLHERFGFDPLAKRDAA